MPKSCLSARLASLSVVLVAVLAGFAAGSDHALAATSHQHRAAKHTVERTSKPRIASKLPAEGIFGGCDIALTDGSCQQDLQEMAAAGLKVDVMPVNYSEADMAAYAAEAQAAGISVMWEINDPGFWGGAWDGSSAATDYPQFATNGTSTQAVLDTMISFLSSLPGTYGYYAADDEDIAPGSTAGLTSYVNEIKSIDPSHMVMIGANAGQGSENASSGAVMGNEIYPETTQNISNQGNNLAAWDAVQQQITQAQDSADRNGQASAFILQAFTFGDNLTDGEAVSVCTPNMSQSQCASLLLYPSAEVQTDLRNEVLEHSHAKLILWYTFDETFGTVHQAGFAKTIQAPAPAPVAIAARAKARRSAEARKSAEAQKTHKSAKTHKTAKKHAAKK